MGSTGRVWTDDELTTVKTMWLKGHSAAAIAMHLSNGRSRNSIVAKCHRMGWERAPGVGQSNNRLATKRRFHAPSKTFSPVTTKKKKVPKVKEATTPKKVDIPRPTNDPIKFEELTADTCRYAVNNGDPWLFCGAKTTERGKPYCAYHQKKCGDGYGR